MNVLQSVLQRGLRSIAGSRRAIKTTTGGELAEWLRSGLQSRTPPFDSISFSVKHPGGTYREPFANVRQAVLWVFGGAHG